MTDFLDSFLQQVSASAAAAKQNPPTLPVGPLAPAVAPGSTLPSDAAVAQFLNANRRPMATAGGTATDILSQAVNPQVAPAAQAVVQTAPKLAPTLTTPNPALYAQAAPNVAPSAVASAGQSAASTALGGAESAALSSADDALATGIGSRLTQLMPSLAGAQFTKAGLLKGSAVAVGGLMASGWIDQRNIGGENSELDQALKGGVLGAGLGAGAAITMGLGAGPVGWAALAGAGLFAAGNMIFGDNTTAEEKMDKKITMANDTINNLINNPAFGIDADTASQIRLQVAATTEFYKNAKDEAGLTSYLSSLAQTVPSFLMEASQRNQAQQMKMQMQAQFGPVYSRMVDRSSTAAKQAFDIQMQAANAITDPATSAAMKTQAAQQYSAQQDTLAAYAQQIAQSPQQLKPSEQMVVNNTQSLMQQFMGA